MKLLSFVATTFAILAPIVHAQGAFSLHASYSDELVDVGDLDTFWSVWDRMYEIASDRGGLSDVSRAQFNWNCNSNSQKPQLTTRVILDGQWGDVGGVSGWQMRDAVIHSMWRTLEVLGQQESYPVYTKCGGFTWQETVERNPTAACGPRAKTACPSHGRCSKGVECQHFAWGHKLPSLTRINVYNPDGSLRADAYQVRISSATKGAAGGCGKLGAITEVLASFIPGVGKFFERGIKVACRNGGLP